jgi:Protein of unknown function (DUF2852)
MATGTYGTYDAASGGPQWRGEWHGGFGASPFCAIPRPFLIAGMILGFIFWWPIGLATLAFMIGSKRMCRSRRYRMAEAGWGNQQGQQGPGGQAGFGPWAGPWSMWRNMCGGFDHRPAQTTTGNAAFDEYRAETLRRLEEEQQEFAAFLERLRVAKDKSEFDAFMANRRQRPQTPPEDQSPAVQ